MIILQYWKISQLRNKFSLKGTSDVAFPERMCKAVQRRFALAQTEKNELNSLTSTLSTAGESLWNSLSVLGCLEAAIPKALTVPPSYRMPQLIEEKFSSTPL